MTWIGYRAQAITTVSPEWKLVHTALTLGEACFVASTWLPHALDNLAVHSAAIAHLRLASRGEADRMHHQDLADLITRAGDPEHMLLSGAALRETRTGPGVAIDFASQYIFASAGWIWEPAPAMLTQSPRSQLSPGRSFSVVRARPRSQLTVLEDTAGTVRCDWLDLCEEGGSDDHQDH